MNGRRLWASAALAVLVVLLAGCGSSTPPPAGDGLLGLQGSLLSGDHLDGDALVGEPVVLWFWAPWCATCRSEAPNVDVVSATFGDEVTFLGVAGRGEQADMERFVADTGVDGFEHLVDGAGAVWASFGVTTQPSFAFVDAHGEVEVVVGALGRAGLTERVERLVAS